MTPGATGTISWTGFTGGNHGDLKFTSNTDFANRSSVVLTDVMGWGGGTATPQAGYVAAPSVSDELKNLRLGAKRTLNWGWINGVDFGLLSTDRKKTSTTQEGFLVIAGATSPFAGVTIQGPTRWRSTALTSRSGTRVARWARSTACAPTSTAP